MECSESFAKGSSPYLAIVAHSAGERSVIFKSLILFDIIETLVLKDSAVTS